MKTFSSKFIRIEILLACISCLFTLSASAQTATVAGSGKGIGPAPANTPQHQILNSALSPQTRQTLQQAMNSVSVPAAK